VPSPAPLALVLSPSEEVCWCWEGKNTLRRSRAILDLTLRVLLQQFGTCPHSKRVVLALKEGEALLHT